MLNQTYLFVYLKHSCGALEKKKKKKSLLSPSYNSQTPAVRACIYTFGHACVAKKRELKFVSLICSLFILWGTTVHYCP